MESLLVQAVLWLSAAVLLVPLAARLGLGSVLGYLIAGVALGPWGLRLVGEESAGVLHFAELGVVMMLFLVGLELDPSRLWRLRGPVFGLGGLQLVGTAALATPVGLAVGLPWQQALAVGLVVAMSSTAIAIQSLTEKGLLRTEGGQTGFAILLFQDVAVIPLLALFPLLATLPVHHAEGAHAATTLVDGLPAWQHGLAVLAAIAAVVGGGRLLAGPALRAIAATGLREMFTAVSLLLVLAVAVLMGQVGLSAALGTFVAGVVLANSEYRHELESDLAPFKGLLLGLFFMAVGSSIDFGLVLARPAAILGLLLAAVIGKSLVLGGVARAGGLSAPSALVLIAALSQVGEFAFVLFAFARDNGVLPAEVTEPMVAVTAFSMALSPLLFVARERLEARRSGHAGGAQGESDVVDEHHPVIIAGYGRFGQIAGRLLRAHGVGVTVLDVDSEQVQMLARFGHKVFYGDASRPDLLHAAGAATAKLLIIAIDEPEKIEVIVQHVHKHHPHLAILARARGRTEAYTLLDHGVEGVYRETYDTAVRVGVDALRLLGVPAHAANRAGQIFRRTDEATLRELAAHRNDGESFVTTVRERMRDLERVMQADSDRAVVVTDEGWDAEPLREAVKAGVAPQPPT